MKIIRPITVTDAVLVSSDVPETDHAAYNAGTAYAEGDRVISTTTHRIYESVQAANTGHALTDTAWWLDVSATNRWKMFDAVVQSQTENADSIEVVLEPGRLDSLALLNIDAQSYQVILVDNTTALTVYDSGVVLLEDLQNIGDWYEYFFEPVPIRKSDIVLTDIPPYSDCELTVALMAPTATVKLGMMVVGLYRSLGSMQWRPRVGIVDYSVKAVDDFGSATITERAFAKRMSAEVIINNELVDYVIRVLSEYRATPVVWAGSDEFTSTILFGFFRSFDVVIDSASRSYCNLEIEGLS